MPISVCHLFVEPVVLHQVIISLYDLENYCEVLVDIV